MNKKALGSSLRRGVLTGTVAGFVAGWSAFVGHGKQLDTLQQDAWQEVEQKKADLVLPPIPSLPELPPVPASQSFRLRYGPDEPLPRVAAPVGGLQLSTNAPRTTSGSFVNPTPAAAGPAATPAPVPIFAPLPTLPPAPALPAPITRTSTPK